MNNQVLFTAATSVGLVIAISSAASAAGRPFGRYLGRSSSSSSSHAQTYRPQSSLPSRNSRAASARGFAANLLDSPERLEQIYGPSILTRGAANPSNSNVATKQPQ